MQCCATTVHMLCKGVGHLSSLGLREGDNWKRRGRGGGRGRGGWRQCERMKRCYRFACDPPLSGDRSRSGMEPLLLDLSPRTAIHPTSHKILCAQLVIKGNGQEEIASLIFSLKKIFTSNATMVVMVGLTVDYFS